MNRFEVLTTIKYPFNATDRLLYSSLGDQLHFLSTRLSQRTTKIEKNWVKKQKFNKQNIGKQFFEAVKTMSNDFLKQNYCSFNLVLSLFI